MLGVWRFIDGPIGYANLFIYSFLPTAYIFMISIFTFIYAGSVEMMGSALDGTLKTKVSLYDHRPYPLFEDDYLRVCQIPKRKVRYVYSLDKCNITFMPLIFLSIVISNL